MAAMVRGTSAPNRFLRASAMVSWHLSAPAAGRADHSRTRNPGTAGPGRQTSLTPPLSPNPFPPSPGRKGGPYFASGVRQRADRERLKSVLGSAGTQGASSERRMQVWWFEVKSALDFDLGFDLGFDSASASSLARSG